MKRWGLLAAAALLSVGTALAEEEPSRHIHTTISGEAYAVVVDAGVYGEEQKAVQAYRVTTLDLGKNPEAHFDLALWFGADALLEKTGGDYTIFYPKGEDAEIGARDEAGFSPYGLNFERATNARLEFPLERWNYRQIQEKTNAAEIPEGISLTDATDSILSIASALGVTMARRPVFISVMTQADWQAETEQKMAWGIAPDEHIVSDWTKEDESVQLNYRQFFHDLPVFGNGCAHARYSRMGNAVDHGFRDGQPTRPRTVEFPVCHGQGSAAGGNVRADFAGRSAFSLRQGESATGRLAESPRFND